MESCFKGGIYMINWIALWMKLFGTTTWLHVNIGFWVSMGISALVAITMVIIFWNMKPCKKTENQGK